MTATKSRRIELDYAKGFAILFLILSHSGTGEKLGTWIFSFHMPIFFVICGMLQAMKHSDGIPFKNFGSFLVRRSRQLVVPYLVFGLALTFFYGSLNLVSGGGADIIWRKLFALVTFQGIDSMWFIPVFMLAELIFLFAYAKLPKAVRFIGCLLLIIMLAVVSYFGMPEQWYLRELLKITIGLVFIYIGFLFEKYNIVSRIPWYVALISIAVCSVLAEINGFTAIGSLEISRVWIFFLNGSIISVAFVALFKFISDKSNRKLKVLDFFGRNTIVVLCTNNLIIEIIRLLEHKLAGDIFVNGGILGTFAFAIILTLIEAVCIRFAEGKLGVLFGKRKVLK